MREREIRRASKRIGDAPDLLEVRTSQRGRVPKREWPEVEASELFLLRTQLKTQLRPLPSSLFMRNN